MRRCSLLKIVGSMVLIATAVAVSPAGLAQDKAQRTPAPRTAPAATKTTAVSRCLLGSAHPCLPTILGARGISRLHLAELST